VAGARQRDREDAHADGANRRQAELDFVPGQAARRQAADANANRREGGEHADPRVAQRHHLAAKQDDDKLQQRAEKPEVRDADHREPEHAVASKRHQTGPDFSPGVAIDPLAGGRRRHVRNAKAQ
jgi:hypothetical protein